MKTSSAFCLVLLLPIAASAQGRYDQFTAKFQKTADQAKVEAATFLGGAGTEWLVGGGFQPDGTVVVAGVALGPRLDLPGVKEVVLGTDAPAPSPPTPKPQTDKNGKVVVDKQGNPKLEPFNWRHENATAFVVRLSADLKSIQSVSRFPWKSCGVTSACVDGQGNIYLAGPATEGVKLLPNVEAMPTTDAAAKGALTTFTYVAKLEPDAARIAWIKTFQGGSSSPTVRVMNDGKIRFTGPDVRTFDSAGRLEKSIVVPGGLIGHVAVNPVDGTHVRAGEHHWPTGREPYRDPLLNIHRPDGKLQLELYNWDGPFVGLDNLRLVSDSAVRAVRYDSNGDLLIYAWSDGGNSVMYREPFDIRTFSKKMDGLGMSAYGAGVLSCAYLIRIDAKTYKVSGGMLWLAYLKHNNKPNSIWINALESVGDGSLAFAGHSAYGLIQTGNAIGDSEPTGAYVALVNRGCDSLRFCSTMPGCGRVDVAEGQRWGIVGGSQKGRPKVLFLGGAVESEDVNGQNRDAPRIRPTQPRFGGGHSDGYILMLDLS